MDSIEKRVNITVLTESEKLKDAPGLKQFEQANEEFKQLLQKGITKERGYNLLSVDDAHLKRYAFNSK